MYTLHIINLPDRRHPSTFSLRSHNLELRSGNVLIALKPPPVMFYNNWLAFMENSTEN